MNNILPGGIIGDMFRIYHTTENKIEILKMGKSVQAVIFERYLVKSCCLLFL